MYRAAVEDPPQPRRASLERAAHRLAERKSCLADVQRIAHRGNQRDAGNPMLAHLRQQALDALQARIEMVVRVGDHKFKCLRQNSAIFPRASRVISNVGTCMNAWIPSS